MPIYGLRHSAGGDGPGTDDAVGLAWYALAVGPNRQFRVREWLAGGAIETFLPTEKIKRPWSDRTKEIERPLFSGYVFARFDIAESRGIKAVPGVLGIVGRGATPEPIPEAEISSLRHAVDSRRPITPCAYVAGELVEVIRGPLAGARGVVKRAAEWRKDGLRLIIGIELFKRAVSIPIDPAEIGKL